MFWKKIVEVKDLDDVSDEITLECGHVIIRICPDKSATTNPCSECVNALIEEHRKR